MEKLSQRLPASDPAPKPRDAEEVRAAVLGDVYTLETRAADSVKIVEQERRMLIFYATTNTDAPLERDAVS